MTNILTGNNSYTGNNILSTATFTSLNSTTGTISNIYSNTLTLNSSQRRAAGDVLEVFATLTSPQYLYFDNNSKLEFHINSNSSSPWYIDTTGLGTFATINST